MQNNYKYQRTVPEDISQNFTISPDDPKVPTTPERNSPYYNGVDYEAEISSILQTPPSSQEPTHHHTIRRTPGAEIAGNVNTRLEEFDSPFQILQALQNLKLSTEPGSYESAESSYPYSTSSREPTASPFTDQYSLWGPQPTQNRRFESNTSIMGSSNSSNLSHFNQTAEYNAFDNPFNSRMMNQSAQQYPHFMHGPASGNAQPFWFTGGSSGGGGFNMPPHHPTTNPNSSMNSGFSTPPIPESSHHSRNSDSQGGGYSMQQARNHAPVVHRRQASTSESSRPIVPSSSHKRSASTSNEEVVKSSTPIQIKSNANAGKEKESNSNSLADSPTSNMKFKQFYREFKQKEKETYREATSFAMENLKMLPEKVHWRVFLELADLAKRENRIDEARGYYEQVNRLEPTAAQGWLEYAKMEEECGNLNACKRILSSGLSNCTVNESLMVKCLKHYERMENLEEARQLLGALKDIPIERTWRTIMEGGLLEARQGNILVARQVFHYLIRSVPWYGPIYQEACRFEEKCEEPENAIQFVESGLRENPRYGPLWFSALRLNEKLSENGDVSSVHETIERAVKSISKELIWKLYFEAAQIEERAGNIDVSREFYVKSVSYCPENLLWKVWMGGARTELNYDNIEIARKLLKRALKEVPPKMKAMVLLECSRLEEYANNLDKAREILAKAKKYTKHEWKVFLESVLLEMRANNLERAIDEAQRALEIHTGTGRLWAVMIQLKQSFGIESQMNVFRTALSEVPKSGEVWCEGARIALQQKNFEAARKYINFAIQFTPQYGDSFIEYLRLEILEKDSNANLRAVEQACVNADPNYGALWLHCKRNPLDSTRNVIREAIRLLTTPQSASDEVPAETALMVNDIYQNVHQRSKEERRKAIFL